MCASRVNAAASSPLVAEHYGAARCEHAADAVGDGDLGALDLCGRHTTHLAHALLQRVHAVHARVHVAETPTVGVERKLAARCRVAPDDEGRGLARLAEAQFFNAVEGQM